MSVPVRMTLTDKGVGVTKPTAQLEIQRTANGGHVYRLKVDGKQIWLTHALATAVGRDGVRSRMERWLAQHPHKVVMVGSTPPVQAGPLDEQEIAFWRTFEDRLGWELWTNVEQLCRRKVKRPDTIAGWAKTFQMVDQALQAETAVA